MNAKFELQEIEQNVIVQAFAQVGGTDALFERIAQEARSFVPDVTTDKGRKAIGSLAAKVSSSKKLAEKYALDLVAEKKAEVKVVDTDRIQFCKKMDTLRDEILSPRDAWEQAEKDRVSGHNAFIMSFVVMSAPQAYENRDSQFIKGIISEIENTVIDDSLEEFKDQAELAKFKALEVLRPALIEREKYEAEQAELDRLRQADMVRQQQERDAQIARDATEMANREAEEKARFEAEKVQREKAEAEQREARLLAEKEAAVLREQQLKIQAEQQAKQAEIDKQQAIEAERMRLEIQRADQVEAERKAEESRKADVEHRRLINREAFDAIQALCLGVPEAQIKELIGAIVDNKIPHISIKF